MKRRKLQAFQRWKAFFSAREGELLWEPIVVMLIIVIMILNCMNLLQMMVKYQHVHYISKELAQTIELNGQVTSDVKEQLRDLNDKLQTNAKLTVGNVNYFDSSKKIQFRDSFTVVVEDSYDMTILTPAFSKRPIVLKIPIKSTIEGMSEVYWKD